MESLRVLAESMQEASALLADQDGEESLDQYSSFLNVVALGSTGAGKSAVLNSLIGYAVLPTGENEATRAPVVIDLETDDSGSKRGLTVQLDGKPVQVSATEIRHELQKKFTRSSTTERIQLKLKSASAPPLRLIDLPGMDSSHFGNTLVRDYIDSTDALLLVVVPATSVRDITGSQALKIAQDIDHEGSRTVGVISKIDQAASDPKSLAAVQAVLSGQGPSITSKFTWIALIGQSVSIAGAHTKDDSLITAWKAETESLKSILGGASSTRLGRSSLVDAIAKQIRQRIQRRLPNLLSSLEGRSQDVEEELVRLGEKMVETEEGTRAVALELCREFEDKFLEHINSGEGGSHRVVTSFEGTLPNRIKQLPLQELFDLNGLKKVVLEADGYLPYLLSPEKGLRELIRRAIDLAKDPAKSCVDEVHRVLLDIVSSAASATPGLGRFPPLKREMISVASSALDEYRVEAKQMVVDLVDMERAYIPPQHFTRLMQRRLDRARREDEVKNKTMKKAQEAEQAILNRSTAQTNGSLKAAKDGDGKEAPDGTANGEKDKTGYLSKRSATSADTWNKRWFVLNEKSNKLGYMKKPDDKRFQGVINLEECLIEELSEEEISESRSSKSKDSSKQANGTEPNLTIKISNKVAYRTVLKAQHVVVLKAETVAEKTEWMTKLRQCTDQGKGPTKTVEVMTPLRTSMSDGALDTVITRRADPEEELRIMAQEVRDYVEAVLNSLSANIPKAAIFCQVEKSKDSMLSTLYKSISALPTGTIKELLQEDAHVKRRRERCERQASLLSRLVRQLSNNEARVSMSNGYIDGAQNGYSQGHGGEDWRIAFEDAAKSPSPRMPSSGFSSSTRRSVTPHRGEALENGDSTRRTPTRRPPPPVPGIGGASPYRQ